MEDHTSISHAKIVFKSFKDVREFFLAPPDPRGHVTYYHHVVFYLFTFQSSPQKPLGHLHISNDSKISQTCIKRSPLGQRQSGLIRQVTF